MLENCFQIFWGISETMEQKLWKLGIKCWDDVLQNPCPETIQPKIWRILNKNIEMYRGFLSANDFMTLGYYIPKKMEWRVIPNYQGNIAYLDVETTGLSKDRHKLTTIAVFDGEKVHTFVQGKNLQDFKMFIKQFPAIATFNGKSFDIPFIKHHLNLEIPHLHFDVCLLLRKIGIKGGLKKIEKRLNISRGIMSELDGFHAVKLWYRYKSTGKEEYLNTLLAYNSEDVLNLEFLLNFAYNGLINEFNLPAQPLSLEEFFVRENINPFIPDRTIVNEMKRLCPPERHYGHY